MEGLRAGSDRGRAVGAGMATWLFLLDHGHSYVPFEDVGEHGVPYRREAGPDRPRATKGRRLLVGHLSRGGASNLA